MNGHGDRWSIDREVLLAANEDAARFFRDQLLAPTNSGPREYLAARGFGALLNETPWTVGYAPARWTGLVEHLAVAGYSDATLLEAGLACRTRHGNLVDRFRDRIVFGIRSLDGELVGFTARSHPAAPSTVPKYLNTPTTAIYNKGAAPFGLGEQRDSIRNGAVPVLAEGPFDAVAVQMAHQENEPPFAGLALCGTALSGRLASDLAQLNSRQVVLAFDGDAAGDLATERAACALASKFVDVRTISQHDGSDPAELLARSGPQAVQAQLLNAVPASDRIIGARIDGWADRLDNAEAKVGCLREAAVLLTRLRPTDPAYHVHRLSERLGLNEETVTRELVEATSPEPPALAVSMTSHTTPRTATTMDPRLASVHGHVRRWKFLR